MPFSVDYANNLLSLIFAKTKTLNAPTFVYMGLSTNDPEADGGTFKELSGNNYQRLLISSREDAFPDYFDSASNRTIRNRSQMVFNKATADWPTAYGFGLFYNSIGGTPFYYGALAKPVFVPAEAVALFDPNTFSITLPAKDTTAT